MKTELEYFLAIFFIFIVYSLSAAQLGLWSSRVELADKPMSGIPWESVKNAADQNFYPPVIEENDHPSNVYCLAAAIVFVRTGDISYFDRVVQAVEKLITDGKPGGNTLRWARNTGAFALAADLVEYRTSEFEIWCRNVAEIWKASDDRTLLSMFKQRPNNWGAMAFGSLCALYSYLQDTTRLNEIRDFWKQGVTGPNPGYKYGDLSWQFDEMNPRLINPKGSIKKGLCIDGVIPDDQRRAGSFTVIPKKTNYHWGHLQGIITAARILDRVNMSIWAIDDSAIYRAAHQYQVRWESQFSGFAAEGDDEWLLPFLDDAYGSNWSGIQEHLWEHGKIAGWPYVVWKEMVGVKAFNGTIFPAEFVLYQNSPNPFNPTTKIRFNLDQSSLVKLFIYDIRGQLVSILEDRFLDAGKYTYVWYAIDSEFYTVSSGIYLCCLQSKSRTEIIKMIYIR